MFVHSLTTLCEKRVIFVFFGLCDLPDELFSEIADFCPDSGKMGWCNRMGDVWLCAVCGAGVRVMRLFRLRAAILGRYPGSISMADISLIKDRLMEDRDGD